VARGTRIGSAPGRGANVECRRAPYPPLPFDRYSPIFSTLLSASCNVVPSYARGCTLSETQASHARSLPAPLVVRRPLVRPNTFGSKANFACYSYVTTMLQRLQVRRAPLVPRRDPLPSRWGVASLVATRLPPLHHMPHNATTLAAGLHCLRRHRHLVPMVHLTGPLTHSPLFGSTRFKRGLHRVPTAPRLGLQVALLTEYHLV